MASNRKRTDLGYHVKSNMDVMQTGVKSSCDPTQFTELPFFGPQYKPHGVTGLSKQYHLQLDPKLVHGICEIFPI